MDFVVAAEVEGGGCVEEEEMLGAWISIIGMPMCGFVIARRRGFVESIIVVGGRVKGCVFLSTGVRVGGFKVGSRYWIYAPSPCRRAGGTKTHKRAGKASGLATQQFLPRREIDGTCRNFE